MIHKILKIKCVKYNEDILSIIYPSQYFLTSSVIRIQEFDNSIDSNKFTLDSILDAYVYKHGKLSYFSDWAGFCITDETIKGFYDSLKLSLSDKEKVFFSAIKKNIKNWKNSRYCVVCSTNNKSDFKHELAHCFFYLYKDYENEMTEMVKKLSFFSKIRKKLIKLGYSSDSIIDECQAYLSTSNQKFLKEVFNISTNLEILKFRQVYNKFKGLA